MLNRLTAWVAGAALALVWASACTEKGRSLILVDVDAEVALAADLDTVTVTARQGTREVGKKSFDWVASGVNHFGIYVSKDVTGSVTLAAEGFNAVRTRIAMSTTDVPADATRMVQPGVVSQPTAILHLVLSPSIPGTGGSAGGTTGSGGGGVGGLGGGLGTGGISTGGTGAGGTGTGGTGTGGGIGGRGGSGTGGLATGGAAGGAPGGSWRSANMVEGDLAFDDWTPSVAVDATGNAVLVYRHGPNIRASRLNAATGAWAAPVAVDARSGGQAYSPAVAVDRNGRWLAIWQQDNALAFPGIWQSTSTDGVTWSAPTAISTVAGYGPELAINRDGAAVAAWSARNAANTSYVIVASVKTTATGEWLTPMEMRPSQASGSLIQKVAMSGTGEAFVIWEDYDDRSSGAVDSIWLRRFSANAWRPAALVETYNGGVSDTSNVAANSVGQAIVAWRQRSTAADEIWASTFSAAGVQAAPALVAQAAFIPWDPAIGVTLDETGVATIAWASEVQARINVYTSRAPAGQAWPSAMAMETDNQAALVNNAVLDQAKPAPVVRGDLAGNVFLTWRKRVGATRFDLWGRRFSAGTWAPAALLETDDAAVGGVSFPALGVGTGGVAVAAWYYRVADSDPTTNRIWANVWR